MNHEPQRIIIIFLQHFDDYYYFINICRMFLNKKSDRNEMRITNTKHIYTKYISIAKQKCRLNESVIHFWNLYIWFIRCRSIPNWNSKLMKSKRRRKTARCMVIDMLSKGISFSYIHTACTWLIFWTFFCLLVVCLSWFFHRTHLMYVDAAGNRYACVWYVLCCVA